MEVLFKLLTDLYNQELSSLNIGYGYNTDRLELINDVVNIIDYIENARPSRDETIKIIQYYGRI